MPNPTGTKHKPKIVLPNIAENVATQFDNMVFVFMYSLIFFWYCPRCEGVVGPRILAFTFPQ